MLMHMAFVVGTHGEFKRGDDRFDPAVGPPRGKKVAHKSTPRGRLGAGVKQEVVREGTAGEREDGAVGGAGAHHKARGVRNGCDAHWHHWALRPDAAAIDGEGNAGGSGIPRDCACVYSA